MPDESSAHTQQVLGRGIHDRDSGIRIQHQDCGAQVIENFCETEWKPVTIHIADQKYSVDWIDEETSRRLFEQGCGQTAACYYELTLDGVTVNGKFAYVTDLLKGEYTFVIDANENSELLNATTTDLAS